VATKHAKVLEDLSFARLMGTVAQGPHAARDQVLVLLSYKAGLRAAEIAGLDWADVTDADGKVRSDLIYVPSDIAKRGRERTLPMNPQLYMALLLLRSVRPGDKGVIYGIGQGRERMSPVAVRVWFLRLYRSLGFEGCSSHSGRRTFITRLARKANLYSCSLKDVQNLAGHAYLSSTESYIEPSENVGRLISAI